MAYVLLRNIIPKKLKKAAASGNIIWLLNRHGTTQFVGLSVSGAGSSTPPR